MQRQTLVKMRTQKKGGYLPEQLYNNQNLKDTKLQRAVYNTNSFKRNSVVEESFFKGQELPSCCDLHLGLVSIYTALFLGHKRSVYKTYGNSDLAFPLNTQYNYLRALEHTTHLVCVGCRILNTMS